VKSSSAVPDWKATELPVGPAVCQPEAGYPASTGFLGGISPGKTKPLVSVLASATSGELPRGLGLPAPKLNALGVQSEDD
jgi:hypothetical protein